MKVFSTGNVRSLPIMNDVSNYGNFAAPRAIYILFFSRQAYKHVSDSTNQLDASGSKL